MFIDYVSVSLYDHRQTFGKIVHAMDLSFMDALLPPSLGGRSFDDADPVYQRPYPHGLMWSDGVRVLWGNSDTVLIVLTGAACREVTDDGIVSWLQGLPDNGMLKVLNVSRLDVATDLDSDQSPFKIVSNIGIQPRIKSRNYVQSQSGDTFYIGSRSSDRMCRVYAYSEPHPRAGVPRVEFQLSKDVASPVANALVSGDTSVKDVFINCFNKTFAAPWATAALTEAPVTRQHQRGNAGTVTWFYKQVAPALRRLLAEGEITLIEIVEEVTKDN